MVISFLDLVCLSVLRWFWFFLYDGVKLQRWSLIITVWHPCVVWSVVSWSWSFRSVCMIKPVLVVAVCLLSWQTMDPFCELFTSLHDVKVNAAASHTGGDDLMNGNVTLEHVPLDHVKVVLAAILDHVNLSIFDGSWQQQRQAKQNRKYKQWTHWKPTNKKTV